VANGNGKSKIGKNLLDNADWRYRPSVVNQRGKTQYDGTGNGHALDRWRIYGGANALTLNVGESSLSFTAGSIASVFNQHLENPRAYAGADLTVSIDVAGEIHAATGTIGQTQTGISKNLPNGWGFGIWADMPGNVLNVFIDINNLAAAQQNPLTDVRRMKLEIGKTSTMKNDPPQEYKEELAKCQRHQLVLAANETYKAIGIGLGVWSSTINIFISTPVTMRANPQIETNGSLFALDGDGAPEVDVSNSASVSPNGVWVSVSLKSGTPVNGKFYKLQTGETPATFILNANL
jgi:hypothetical protein